MFKGEQFQPSTRQSGGGASLWAKEQGVMWSNCKIEKLHVIIFQAECDDVKGRTNDDALSLLEAFPSRELKVTRSAAQRYFFLPFLWIHNVTINPAQRGLMLQECF